MNRRGFLGGGVAGILGALIGRKVVAQEPAAMPFKPSAGGYMTSGYVQTLPAVNGPITITSTTAEADGVFTCSGTYYGLNGTTYHKPHVLKPGEWCNR